MKNIFIKVALSFVLVAFFFPVCLLAKGSNELKLVGDISFPITVVAGEKVYTDVTLPVNIDVKKAKYVLIYASGHRAQTIKLERTGNNVIGMLTFGVSSYRKNKLITKEIEVILEPSDVEERYLTDIATFYYDNGEKKEAMAYLQNFLSSYPEDSEANGILERIAIDEQERADRRERRYSTWMNIGNILSDLGNSLQNTSTSTNNSSYSSNSDETLSLDEGTSSCHIYQDSYARAERKAKNCYDALANAAKVVDKDTNQDIVGGRHVHLGNIVTTSQLRKTFRKMQQRMKEIRKNAAKKGCTILQSNYETISVVNVN